MGAEQKKICINQQAQYIGQVCLTNSGTLIPQGKGRIIKKKNIFQGNFINGNLTKGKFSIKCQKENMDTIQYQGCFQKGTISGEGKLIINKQNPQQKLIAEGIFSNNTFQSGKFESVNNYQIIGAFSQNTKIQNQGIYHNILSSIKITGEFLNSNLTGKGKYQFPNGDIIEGNFYNGKPSEKFVYKSKQFSIESYTCNHDLDGIAKINLLNKTTYEGQLKNGKLNGKGKIVYPNGTILQGNFLSGSASGSCKIIYPAEHELDSYQGQIEDNQPNGIGILIFKKGIIYKGYFYYGKKNGPGYLIYGTIKYRCFYSMDKLVAQPKKMQ